MLSAQKALLQASVLEGGTQLQGRELEYFSSTCSHIMYSCCKAYFFTDNFSMISTMSSIIAGFAFSGLLVGSDFTGISLNEHKKITTINMTVTNMYFAFAALAIGCCLLSCVICTVINVRGPGLALRGPDGSLKIAVNAMRQWQRYALYSLTVGVVNFHLEGMTYAWLMLTYRANAIFVTTILGFVLVLMLFVIFNVFRSLQIQKTDLHAGELTDTQLLAIVRRLQGGSKVNPSSGSYISDYGATSEHKGGIGDDEEEGGGIDEKEVEESTLQRRLSSSLQPYLDTIAAHVGGASFGDEEQEDNEAVTLTPGNVGEKSDES